MSLHICADSPEPLLLNNDKSTKVLCAGMNIGITHVFHALTFAEDAV